MNRVILCGRLTRDADVRYSVGDDSIAIARFTLAVDRRFRKEEQQQTADFISCVAFGKRAEFLQNYGTKGMKFIVEGRLQTGSYENKEGNKVYTTDVVVENIEFAESKKNNEEYQHQQSQEPQGQERVQEDRASRQTSIDEFMPVPDDLDNLPFE
ncbi:MAG: single-stranded DNA-binding protein [Lachnospiraceae bacterium]|nr:single-stranded DNA-binding protein [Lachnospiraceae bacterium]